MAQAGTHPHLSLQMVQQRLNHVIIPRIHKEKLQFYFIEIMFSICSDFISKNQNRKTFFGHEQFYSFSISIFVVFFLAAFVLFRSLLISFETIKHQILMSLLQNQKLARKSIALIVIKNNDDQLLTCSLGWFGYKVEPTLD